MNVSAIRFRGISHTYASGRRALDSIDLEIMQGERVGLIGPSGAGKSTLLRMVNGLVTPTEGTVEALGEEVARLNDAGLVALRRQIGMVFQDFALVDRLSVLTNVLIGRLGYTSVAASILHRFASEDQAMARRSLAAVGLEGLETRLVRQLSGGQKQRVGIARALSQEPRIILGDEPTANLDVRTASDVLELLVDLGARQRATLLLSLHDVRAARQFCTRIVALRDGQIVWDGVPADLTEPQVEAIFYG